MINRKRRLTEPPSFWPKFSDADIIKSVLSSDIWAHLFLGEKRATWLLVKALCFLKMEMFISPIKSFLRYAHGRRTMGIIITVMSTLMMIAFNTQNVLGYLVTFFPFAAPVVPFFMDTEQTLSMLFINVRSHYLLYFWICYLLVSMLQLMLIKMEKGATPPPGKRGNSILHALLFRHIRVSEKLVQGIIEPVLVGGVGYALWTTDTDFTMGLFLVISAFCIFFQELYDTVLKISFSR